MIEQTVMDAIGRHERIALSFSGGKDSLACVYLLRPVLDRFTVYHVDTGDLLPETVEIVAHVRAMVPRFVHIQTDTGAWIAQNGLPSDLVPYASHPIGRALGQPQIPIVSRYDCCFFNVMWPLMERVKADGCTLLIRGTKASDVPKLPVANGDVGEGIELLYPIQDWTDDDVLTYLREVGAPIARQYETVRNSLDCARCSGWWGEGRGAYLRRYHPGLFADYRARLDTVMSALRGSFAELHHEVSDG